MIFLHPSNRRPCGHTGAGHLVALWSGSLAATKSDFSWWPSHAGQGRAISRLAAGPRRWRTGAGSPWLIDIGQGLSFWSARPERHLSTAQFGGCHTATCGWVLYSYV